MQMVILTTLPLGFEVRINQQGKMFYHNPYTGETRIVPDNEREWYSIYMKRNRIVYQPR